MKQPKILFFIEGAVPTAHQNLIAMKLGVPVQFRNAEWAQEGVPEPCDGVIGEVPDLYDEFPDAEDVCVEYREMLEGQLASLAESIGGPAYVPRRGTGSAQKAVPETDDEGKVVTPPVVDKGWQGNR